MAIDIKQWNQDFIEYAVVPEKVFDSDVETIKLSNEIQNDTHGWTTDKTMKKLGEIPYSVMYNYCLAHGVPVNRMTEFFTKDNGKNAKILLDEFTVFKVDPTIKLTLKH